jgi:hypothetical protein
MTQNQIDRLRECKKKAMELESELRSLSLETSEWISLDESIMSPTKTAQQITDIFIAYHSLSKRLQSIIL